MKQFVLHNLEDAEKHQLALTESAHQAQSQIEKISKIKDPLSFLEQLKFERIGCDPLDKSKPWNLIEQINQTFTYLASFKAAALLFKWHPNMESLTLNLGTANGTDIESQYDGGVAAEIFAATSPSSNQKLKKDIEKVLSATASYKYVFFICPNIEKGYYETKLSNEVKVWSLGK